MSGDEGGDAPHLDEISEIEAEAAAEIADLDVDLTHRLHRPDDEQLRAAPTGDVLSSGPPPNLRRGRQRFLVAYLRVALVVAFVVGVIELLVPDEHRDAAGVVMVAVFVVAPIGRIVWLMVRWFRLGDWRFALVGGVLLAVVFTGLLAR